MFKYYMFANIKYNIVFIVLVILIVTIFKVDMMIVSIVAISIIISGFVVTFLKKKALQNINEESMVWESRFWILLGTYLITFPPLNNMIPLPLIAAFAFIDKIDISSIGLILGVFSIIGVYIIQINYRKKELEFIFFQLAVVCIMYLSWLFLTIYGINSFDGGKDFWVGFRFFLALSAPFQAASLVIFCKLLEQIYLLRFKNVSPDVSKVEK